MILQNIILCTLVMTSTSLLSINSKTSKLECLPIAEFDLKWSVNGPRIKAHGIVNDTLVDLAFEQDETISSGFFATATPVMYKRVTVHTTTPPTMHCRSDTSLRTFSFSDYRTVNPLNVESAYLARSSIEPLTFTWSVAVDEEALCGDIIQYINWVSTAGYSY
jgi:hypothetical protein